MTWLETLDADLFRFINLRLMNPVCDAVMPFISGNSLFFPAVLLLSAVILWKGRLRGFLFLALMGIAVGLTDGLLCNTLKHALARPRPFLAFPDVHCLLGRSGSGSIDLMVDGLKPGMVDAVVGIDARGFIFAAAAAVKLEAGFVPVRKKGKLPYKCHEQDYALEYGTATVAMHVDALKPGSRVLLIDDLLATGGTAAAAAALVQKLGAEILQISFLIELSFLNGRQRLKQWPIRSLVVY